MHHSPLRFKRLEQSEEARSLSDVRELDAKGLDLDEKRLHVDDPVPNQRLEEHADETHETRLHVLVFDILATLDTVRDVEVNELGRKINCSCQSIHHLHAMQGHIHVH